MRLLIGTVAVLAAALAAVVIWATRHPEIEPVDASSASFEAAAVARGEMLATAGGCASCHGDDLAGGQPLETPFGTIFATNITPDPETGIGLWSEQAFRRAMRQGVDRQGRYLYPAFPYDNFTNATDDDIADLYAYLVSQPAVSRAPAQNDLRFPFNVRLLLAGWTALFLQEGPWTPDPDRDEVWNRGAYLAEGLGHCSACHSPRNRFGARDAARAYAGGFAEGWWSPALTADSPAPMPWTRDELVNYLFDGWEENHGIAAGPMKEVVENLSLLPEADVEAIAEYIASYLGPPDDAARTAALNFAEDAALAPSEVPSPDTESLQLGAEVFMAKCANCHRSGTESVPLALASAVRGPQPHNFLRIVIEGVTPTENAFFVRPMPASGTLSAEELGHLAEYVRHRFATEGPWSNVDVAVRDIVGAETD